MAVYHPLSGSTTYSAIISHLANAQSPIPSTFGPISNVSSDLQFSKAEAPIERRSGMYGKASRFKHM